MLSFTKCVYTCFLRNFTMFKVSFVLYFPVLLFGYKVVLANDLILKAQHEFVLTPCEDEVDCEHLANATCFENFCMCNGSKVCIDRDRNSRVVTEIGKPCQHDTDCNIQYSECSGSDEKVCVCKVGRTKSTDARKCLIISEGIGGSCEDSVQCYTKTLLSICQDNKCVCQQHMHEHNGTCYKNAELTQSCRSNPECSLTPFSECIQSRCSCTEGYVPNSVKTTCLPVVKTFGSACFENDQCMKVFGGSAECRDGFCGCKELYQLKQKSQKCVRDMLLGDTCMTHFDCHIPEHGPRKLECILGVCKCKSYYVEEHGYCVSKGSTRSLRIFLPIILIIIMPFYSF